MFLYGLSLSIKYSTVQSFDVEKYLFRPKEDDKAILCPKVSYLSAICALMYLTNCTQPDIAFLINILTRYSYVLTHRHSNGEKHVFHYLLRMINIGLLFIQMN